MKSVSLLVICMFLFSISPTLSLAQDNLQLCTPEQAEIVRVTMTNSTFIGGYGDAGAMINEDVPDVDKFKKALLAFDALQQEWWTEVFPAFPNCDQAQRLGVLGGRVLDEMIIMLSIAHWAITTDNAELTESTNYHRSTQLAIQTEFVALAEEIGALARGESVAPSNTASADAGDSRTNPVPFQQRQHVKADDFEGAIELENYLDDAEAVVLAANRFNDPAPSGKRYVLISFTFTCERDSADSCEYNRVHFSLVGDKGISYRYDSASISGLTDKTEFFGGAEIVADLAFLVDDDDGNFVLFTEYGDPRVFFATT